MRVRQPGLVVTTLVGVAVLVALGEWQRQRLAWKTAKLAEIEASAESPPLTSVAAILQARAEGAPLDFRWVSLAAEPIPDAPIYRVFRADDGIAWELFTPVRSGGQTLFASFQTIPDGQIPTVAVPEQLVGYLRVYDTPQSGRYSVAENRYYAFDPDALWSKATGALPRLYIDTVPGATAAAALPPRRPELPNNHFQYMLTWWSFALILLVVSAILYRRP